MSLPKWPIGQDEAEPENRDLRAAIVDSSGDAILSFDSGGVITSWNNSAQRLFGYAATQAIGQPVSMLTPAGQRDGWPEVVRRLRGGEALAAHDAVGQTRDGHQLDVSLAISPIRDGEGSIIGGSIAARDATDRKRAEQALAAELADLERLPEISCRLIPNDDLDGLYGELVAAAIEVVRADGGTMQTLDEQTGKLCLLNARGINEQLQASGARIAPAARTSCAEALRRRERVVIDYATDDRIAGTPEARQHLEAGVRMAQSTPLITRSGQIVGMLSTHWHQVEALSDRRLHLLDILARQAADLIERALAEQERRRHEERYRTLFEAIDEGFCILQVLFDEWQRPVDYRFLETNPAFTRQTGLIDAVGKTAREVVPDLEAHWFDIYGRVARTGEPTRFSQGSEAMGRWFDVYALRVGEPEVRKAALLFTDVTEQRRLDRERERLLAEIKAEQQHLAELFHHAPSFMCILRGSDFVFERANNLYRQLVGERELIGRPVLEVLPEIESQGFFEILTRVYETGEPYVGKDMRVSLQRQRPVKAGPVEDRWLDFVYQPLRDAGGAVTGIFVQGVDLTERKRAEDALRESEAQQRALNQTLEQRVAERTAEAERRAKQLQLMAKELTDAEHRERRRLAQLLHDDLQQILVAAKMQLRGGDPASVLIEQAIETARSLSTELAPPVLYDVGLRAAMDWLARWVRDKYKLRVEVESDGADPVEDEQLRVLLFEAVRELLLNVVKHADVLEARLTLHCDERQVRVEVQDFGAGFNPEIRRADVTQRGYGLFSLQERFELVGGEVDIDSAPGQGTRIGITLPLRPSPDRAVQQPTAATQESSDGEVTATGSEADRSLRVLLTDDHEVVRRGLAALIEHQQDMHVVAQAGSGEEAVDLTRQHRPDVVVMDISLPGISGIEATQRIMQHRPRTCVIGLSIHERQDVVDALRSAGARAYINKSQAAEELVQAIRSYASAAGHPEQQPAN